MVYELMETMFETHKDRKDKTFHIGQIFIVDRGKCFFFIITLEILSL